MKEFIQLHPLWFALLATVGFYGFLLLTILMVRRVIQSVVLEMVPIEYLEKKWAWKKYHRVVEAGRVLHGASYRAPQPPAD